MNWSEDRTKTFDVMTGVVGRLDETFRRVTRVGDELVEGIATKPFDAMREGESI